jgi:hypothetical protein
MRIVAAIPCALSVVLANAPARADDATVVAAPAPAPRAHLREGVMLGGIVGTILGAFVFVPGVWLASGGLARDGGPNDPGTRYGVLGVGGGLLVVGVTLAAAAGSPPPAAPRLAIGPRSASVAFRF